MQMGRMPLFYGTSMLADGMSRYRSGGLEYSPMHENIDGTLRVLVNEFNTLWEQGKFDYKSVQIAAGHKLLTLRDLLRARNGVSVSARLGPDGKRAPRGWTEWVAANLSIDRTHAARCISYAINPDREYARQHRKYTTFRADVRRIGRNWPNYTDAERRIYVIEALRRWGEAKAQAEDWAVDVGFEEGEMNGNAPSLQLAR
jgi:hypothetical protein